MSAVLLDIHNRRRSTRQPSSTDRSSPNCFTAHQRRIIKQLERIAVVRPGAFDVLGQLITDIYDEMPDSGGLGA